MKKLFICFAVLFLASGCDNSTDTKTLSCTNNNNNENGIISETRYDFKYVGDEIKHVTITYDYTRDMTDENVDGVDADTDGLDQNDDANPDDDTLSSDEVVDGVVGDAIDETVDTVTDTILDIAGIRNNFEKQMSNYDNIEGFSYEVDTDSDDEYRVIYEIDMDKISDDNLSLFDIDRDFDTARTNYEDTGYTCQ